MNQKKAMLKKEWNFDFEEFHFRMKRLEYLKSSDLESYLNNSGIKKILPKTMKEIFMKNEENIQEVWTKSQIKVFSDNSQITANHINFMVEAGKKLNLSILLMFKYLDQIGKKDMAVLKNLNINRQAIIEGVADLYLSEKDNYLKGICSMIKISSQTDRTDIKSIIDSLLENINQDNKFLHCLIENLKIEKEKNNLSNFMLQNHGRYFREIINQDFLIYNIILNFLENGRIRSGERVIFERLLDHFVDQKFSGSLVQISNLLDKKSNEMKPYINTNEKNSINQTMILLGFLLKGIDFRNTDYYLKYYDQIRKLFVDKINKETKSDWKIEFLATTFMIITHCFIRMNEDSIINTNIDFQYVDDHFEQVPSGNYIEELSNLLSILKKFNNDNNSLLHCSILKKLFVLFWNFFKIDREDCFNLFQENPNQYLMKIFTFIAKAKENEFFLINIIGKSEEEIDTTEFVNYMIGNYPYCKDFSFLKMIKALIGTKEIDFSSNILEMLRSLKESTYAREMIDIIMDEETKISNKVDKDKYISYNETIYELKYDINIRDQIIEKGTIYYQKSPDSITFETKINFIQNMISELTTFLVDIKANREDEMPVCISKYLKILCKFINHETQLILQFDEDKRVSFMKVILILFDSLDILHKNSENIKLVYILVKTIKNLIQSNFSNDVIAFMKLYKLFMNMENSNILIEIFISCLNGNNNYENYLQNEKYYLKTLEYIINIFQSIIADDQIWINYYKNKTDNVDKLAINTKSNLIKKEQCIENLRKYYYASCSQNLEDNDYLAMYEDFQELVYINDWESDNLLDNIWDQFLIPFIDNFLNDNFSVNFQSFGIKFKIYTSLIEFLKVFYSKLYYSDSKKELFLLEEVKKTRKDYYEMLYGFSNKIPMFDIIVYSFKVKLDADYYRTNDFSYKKNLGLNNHHLVFYVKQKNCANAEKYILHFLESAVNLLSMLFDINNSLIKNNKEPKDLQIFQDLFNYICEKDNFYYYEFSDFSTKSRINILLAIISLIENKSNNLKFFQNKYRNYDLNCSKYLFKSNLEAETFIEYLNPFSTLEKNRTLTFWKRNQSLKSSIFSLLSKIMKFWKLQNKIRTPLLMEYIYGIYCNIPNLSILKSKFNIAMIRSLNKSDEGLLDFLLECFDSQFSVIETLLLIGKENISKDSPTLLKILAKTLKNFSKLLPQIKEQFSIIETFNLKVVLFIVKLLRSKKLSRLMKEELWRNIFSPFTEVFFGLLNNSSDLENGMILSFVSNKFVKEFYEEKDNYTSDFDISTNLNFTKILCLSEKKRICNTIIKEFLENIKEQYVDFINNKDVFIFKKDYSFFFNKLSENLQTLIHYSLNPLFFDSILALNDLKTILINSLLRKLNELSGFTNVRFSNLNISTISRYNYKDIKIGFVTKNVIDDKKVNNYSNAIYQVNDNFILLRIKNMPEDLCNKIFNYCFMSNIINEIIENQIIVQNNTYDLINILFSFGLTGSIFGKTLNSINFSKTSIFVANIYESLKKEKENTNYNRLTLDQLKKLTNDNKYFDQQFNLKQSIIFDKKEKQYILPQWDGKKFEIDFISLLDPSQRITNLNERNILKISESINSKIGTFFTLFKNTCDKIYRNENLEIDLLPFNNISIILRFLNVYLSNLCHLQNNIFNLQELQQDGIKNTLNKLIEDITMVGNIFKRRSSNISEFNEILRCLYYILFYFKQIGYKSQDIHIFNLKEFLLDLLLLINQQEEKESQILIITLLDWTFLMNPLNIKLEIINKISRILQQPKLSYKCFKAVIDFLSRAISFNCLKDEILQSNLISNISDIPNLINSEHFNKPVFYIESEVTETHVKFLKLLKLINLFADKFENENIMNNLLNLFTDYQTRIEAILSVNNNPNNILDNEIPQSFRTLAYLEELKESLIFITNLSRNFTLWKNNREKQMYRVFILLVHKTIKIFNRELQHKKIKNLVNPGKCVSDKFSPNSRYENLLFETVLTENSNLNNKMMGDSLMKSNLEGTSVHRDFTKYKYTSQSGHITNMFSLYINNLCSNSLFYILYALSPIFNRSDFENIFILDRKEVLKKESPIKFSKSIVDAQYFMLQRYNNLYQHPAIENEFSIKMEALKNSNEAFIDTKGSCSDYEIFSIVENKHICRKAFEISLFVGSSFLKCFEQSNQENVHYWINELNNNKGKTLYIISEFEKYTFKKPHSGYVSIGKSPALFSKRRQSVSIFEGVGAVDAKEGEEDFLVTRNSLECHNKTLEFIRKIYEK